jgi:hypothetical protein
VRIEEGLQIRPFDQQRLVALPAFAVNQVRIEGTVFVGVFQVQSAGFDQIWNRFQSRFCSLCPFSGGFDIHLIEIESPQRNLRWTYSRLCGYYKVGENRVMSFTPIAARVWAT